MNEKSLTDRLEDIDPYDDPGAADVAMDDAKQEIVRLQEENDRLRGADNQYERVK